jgi:hypothetical protein
LRVGESGDQAVGAVSLGLCGDTSLGQLRPGTREVSGERCSVCSGGSSSSLGIGTESTAAGLGVGAHRIEVGTESASLGGESVTLGCEGGGIAGNIAGSVAGSSKITTMSIADGVALGGGGGALCGKGVGGSGGAAQLGRVRGAGVFEGAGGGGKLLLSVARQVSDFSLVAGGGSSGVAGVLLAAAVEMEDDFGELGNLLAHALVLLRRVVARGCSCCGRSCWIEAQAAHQPAAGWSGPAHGEWRETGDEPENDSETKTPTLPW